MIRGHLLSSVNNNTPNLIFQRSTPGTIEKIAVRAYNKRVEKTITNLEIARVFEEIANILDLKDDNVFKIRAVRRATMKF